MQFRIVADSIAVKQGQFPVQRLIRNRVEMKSIRCKMSKNRRWTIREQEQAHHQNQRNAGLIMVQVRRAHWWGNLPRDDVTARRQACLYVHIRFR